MILSNTEARFQPVGRKKRKKEEKGRGKRYIYRQCSDARSTVKGFEGVPRREKRMGK